MDKLNDGLSTSITNEYYTHNSLIDWPLRADNSINNDHQRYSAIENCSQNCFLSDNILDIIKNHEKTTWESIDIMNKNISKINHELNNKIDINTSKLDEIYIQPRKFYRNEYNQIT